MATSSLVDVVSTPALVSGVDGGAGDEGHAGSGEGVESEVAASFCPFVVLLGQDGADEADEGDLPR